MPKFGRQFFHVQKLRLLQIVVNFCNWKFWTMRVWPNGIEYGFILVLLRKNSCDIYQSVVLGKGSAKYSFVLIMFFQHGYHDI